MKPKLRSALIHFGILSLDLIPGMVHAIRMKFWPLFAFMAVQWVVYLAVLFFPRSLFTNIIHTWIGPFPRPYEKASSYFFRAGRCSLLICFVIVTMLCLGAWAMDDTLQQGRENPIIMAILALAGPILAGMALLASLQHFITGLRIRIGRRDYVLINTDERMGDQPEALAKK